MKLTVNLGKDSYPIYIENNILSQAGDYIRKIYHGKRIMIISDDNVFPLYGDRLIHTLDSTYECHHLVLPHGEQPRISRHFRLSTRQCWRQRFPVVIWSSLLAAVSSVILQDLPLPVI